MQRETIVKTLYMARAGGLIFVWCLRPIIAGLALVGSLLLWALATADQPLTIAPEAVSNFLTKVALFGTFMTFGLQIIFGQQIRRWFPWLDGNKQAV